MQNKKPYLVFFIGTTAEYIKLFTIIEKCKKQKIPYKVIATGQNEIANTDIAKETDLRIDLQLSKEDKIIKNALGLFSWYYITKSKSVKMIKNTLTDVDFKKSIFVIHGDTISTVMGAKTAKRLGSRIAHVEAGLRSGKILQPFPEEIDRHIVSKLSSFNFCQGKEYINNLKCANGTNINIQNNTIVDALNYSETIPVHSEDVKNILGDDYCIFVLHRQENLLRSGLVRHVVQKIIDVSKEKKVVFILHKITKNTLVKLNLLEKLQNKENIILFDRVEYFDFMKLLQNSQFVVTDGGSNQEELSYMGKPTLIVRNRTERNDGIGENAIMYNNELNNINKFIKEYDKYKKGEREISFSPTDKIIEVLNNELIR